MNHKTVIFSIFFSAFLFFMMSCGDILQVEKSQDQIPRLRDQIARQEISIVPEFRYNGPLTAIVGTEITDLALIPGTGFELLNYTFSISPDLHSQTGLRFDTRDGSISGTPTSPIVETTYTITASRWGGYEDSATTIAITVFVPAGSSWNKVTAAGTYWRPTDGYTTVKFQDKLWVLGGSDKDVLDDIWNSDDGVNWNKVAVVGTHWSPRKWHTTVVFADKLWVLGGRYRLPNNRLNDIWNSDDGVNWNKVAVVGTHWSPRIFHTAVVFAGKLWVLGGFDGNNINDIWNSNDGINWNKVAVEGTHWSPRRNHATVVFAGKLWVLGGGFSILDDIWNSDDGINWNEIAVEGTHWNPRASHTAVGFKDKLWVLSGSDRDILNDIWNSDDGVNWNEVAVVGTHWSPRKFHTTVVFAGKLWILGSGDTGQNDIWHTGNPGGGNPGGGNPGGGNPGGGNPGGGNPGGGNPGGGNPGGGNPGGGNPGGGNPGGGNPGKEVPVRSGPSGRKPNNNLPTGVPTTPRPTPTIGDTMEHQLLAQSASWTARRNHSSVVYNGKMWVFGGYDDDNYYNDVWSSTDGSTWSENRPKSTKWQKRRFHRSEVYKGKIWLFGGVMGSTYYNDVWSSTDGSTWSEEVDNTNIKTVLSTSRWAYRSEHSSVVFTPSGGEEKIWLLGGKGAGESNFYNDVWSSNDGRIWTKEDEGSWLARRSHSSVVYNNKIWVLGGALADGSFTNDVWFSSDGSRWEQATNAAGWSPRRNHSSVVYDGKMWVFGGFTSSDSESSEAWYSEDGSTWHQVANWTPNTIPTQGETPPSAIENFPGRCSHSSVVFAPSGGQEKIWLLGGVDSNGTGGHYSGSSSGGYFNDVWSFWGLK